MGLQPNLYDLSLWVRNIVNASSSPLDDSRALIPVNLIASPIRRVSTIWARLSQRAILILPVPSSTVIFETLVLLPSLVSISRGSVRSTTTPRVVYSLGPGLIDAIVTGGGDSMLTRVSFVIEDLEPAFR